MIFIKVFANDTDYVSYRDSTGYTKPNVSLSRDTKVVHYNYPMWDANDKQFVDLGLPSGTLWATMNVGASKPSDVGLYFQWGDTSGYTADQVGKSKLFKWIDYKFTKNEHPLSFSKYTTSGATLDLEDDAAHVNMGGDWHIPTPEQIQELTANTTSAWTILDDGISGMTFFSKKDRTKTIFFPAAGNARDGSIQDSIFGSFWCSMLGINTVERGQNFNVSSDTTSLNSGFRYYGLSVRGVLG